MPGGLAPQKDANGPGTATPPRPAPARVVPEWAKKAKEARNEFKPRLPDGTKGFDKGRGRALPPPPPDAMGDAGAMLPDVAETVGSLPSEASTLPGRRSPPPGFAAKLPADKVDDGLLVDAETLTASLNVDQQPPAPGSAEPPSQQDHLANYVMQLQQQQQWQAAQQQQQQLAAQQQAMLVQRLQQQQAANAGQSILQVCETYARC